MDKVLAEVAEMLRGLAVEELLVVRGLVMSVLYPARQGCRTWHYVVEAQYPAEVIGGIGGGEGQGA